MIWKLKPCWNKAHEKGISVSLQQACSFPLVNNEGSTSAILQAWKRASLYRESKPGAPLGTGHAQCCHLLNPHIPEGTKHRERQSRPAGSLGRAFYCLCPWVRSATEHFPFKAGRAMFPGDTACRLWGRKSAAGFLNRPILPSSEGIQPKSLFIWGERCM